MKSTPSMLARDAGLELISRINRWMIVGAVALCALISFIAAQSFHGHTLSSSAQSRASSSSSGGAAGGSSSTGAGIQQPAQAPTPSAVPVAPAAPVVSGGS